MGGGKKDRRMMLKKLARYVEKDKFRKVDKLLSNHVELVDAIVSKKRGRTSLHLASEMGNFDTVRVLMKRGATVSITDSDGSLPLHYAACFCLSKKRYSRNLVSDLVTPLITDSLALLDEANSEGVTCRSLLDALNRRQERNDVERVEAAGRVVQEIEEEKKLWERKLAMEAEDDLTDFVGSSSRFGLNGYDNDGDESKETYDEWADRIYHQFMRRKKPAAAPQPKSEKGPQPKSRMPKLEKPLRAKQEHRRLSRQDILYQKFCDKFLGEDSSTHAHEIRADDFPFTTQTDSNEIVSAVCGSAAQELDAASAKKAIRDELRRWHPDKFMQKYGRRLSVKDRGAIELIVTHISQALIQFGK